MTGFLQPGRCQAVVIKVTTFDLACDLQFNVSCKLVDQTQIEEREKSLMQYLERQKVVNELFTVTEKGEYYEVRVTKVSKRRVLIIALRGTRQLSFLNLKQRIKLCPCECEL